MIDLNSKKYNGLSDEEKKLIQEAFEAGVDSVLDEVYESAVFDLEMNADAYNEAKMFRKRLPNHPSKIDPDKPNDEKDMHQKAPEMRKKLGKLK